MTPVEQIKERLSIVDVVSSYVKLEKAGMNLRARCPFHSERTPSFFVSPARGSFHCFGCNKGGDIFTFIEEVEGANFSEALRTLADRAGVDLRSTSGYKQGEAAALYEILEEATLFFEKNLWTPPFALPLVRGGLGGVEYLRKRGLTDETIKKFRIGYALDSWSALRDYLKGKKYSEQLIEKAGLIISGDRGYYDRFRARIMFPIANSQGRIVGFSGRIFEGLAPRSSKSEVGAKYINSPETTLYNKSRILYGYDKAKRAIMQKNSCIVVEGQMDLIVSHQEGFDNTVAVSGTALTSYHIDLVKRFTDILILAFDADPAGLKASERSVRTALEKGMDVRIAKLPKGLDPADYILKNKTGWTESTASAKHIIDFYLDFLREEGLKGRDLSKQITKKVLPYIAELGSKLDQAHFIKKVADLLEAPERAVQEEVQKITTPPQPSPDKGREELRPPPLGEVGGGYTLQLEEKIAGILLWQTGQGNARPDLRSGQALTRFKQRLEKITGKSHDEIFKKYSSKIKQDLIFQSEMYYGDDAGQINKALDELLDNLEKEILEGCLKELIIMLKKEEKVKNEREVKKILEECQKINKRIHEIKNSRFSSLGRPGTGKALGGKFYEKK